MKARTILECGGRSRRFCKPRSEAAALPKRRLRPPHSKLFLLLALLTIACHRPEVPAHPPVILISIDTLRSDHLPAYGYRGITTHAIDRLAADGIVFERAFSHVPLTLPSHASIFTGLLPAHHGVHDNAAFQLDVTTPTIASILRAHGYATGGVVSAYVLRASTNIGSGFDSYDDQIAMIEGAPTGNLARHGRESVAIGKQWIASHSSEPFFAFVHLFEPHAPYEPSYDGEIVTVDALVGELLDSLRASGLYDDALIILLSDHGEGLRDHGEQEHGVLLYREALQVPLIIKLPRNERRGTRVAEAVQLVDVLPTIAAVTGATPPRTDGHSLLATPIARAVHSETLYPRLHLGWSELHSVVEWPHHLIDGPKPELYDLEHDRRETHDTHEVDRRVYAKLRHDLANAPSAPAVAQRIDPEEARKLAALGYVSAQSQSAAPSTLNPRDHLQDLDALKRVTELMAARSFAEAAALMEQLLTTNPGWSDLRDQLGVTYESLGDLARAEKTYRDAIRATPELAPEFALSLANVLVERGALDDAEAHARLALAHNPNATHETLARIAAARGDFATGRREAELAHSDFVLAQVLLAQNDPSAALTALQRIYSASRQQKAPLPSGYFAVAGEVFLRLGRRDEARMAFTQALQLHPEDRVSRKRLATLTPP
jgi:arylsulfatase A-like enzyme/predicted negative regulator of RcsB-dependent stress response